MPRKCFAVGLHRQDPYATLTAGPRSNPKSAWTSSLSLTLGLALFALLPLSSQNQALAYTEPLVLF